MPESYTLFSPGSNFSVLSHTFWRRERSSRDTPMLATGGIWAGWGHEEVWAAVAPLVGDSFDTVGGIQGSNEI